MLITPEVIASLPPLPEGWGYSYNNDMSNPSYVWVDRIDTHALCLDCNKYGMWHVECGLNQRFWNQPFAGLEGFATLHDAAAAAAIFLALRGEEYPWPNE